MRSQEVNGDGKEDKNYNKIQTTGGDANRDGDKIFYRVILYFERIFHALRYFTRYVCTQ